ncbi:MAG: trehalose-6-phosphate synthase [Holophagaceae bacterium]
MTIELITRSREPAELIIASHRGPYRREDSGTWVRRINGVFAAMEPLLRGGGGTWVCWGPGDGTRALERHREVLVDGSPAFRVHEVLLTDEEARDYYEGFTTEALWPILFCFPSRLQFSPGLWETYRRVNERFAQAIARLAAPHALVWVQDFHLMLLPDLLRKLRPDLRLGFFLHTAFPPADVFGILPWREALLEGILGSDVVGFHIPLYAANFAQCCERYLDARPLWEETPSGGQPLAPSRTCPALANGSRVIRLVALGVGASREELDRFTEQPGPRAYAKSLKERMGVEHLLLSAERLDYVKGPIERIRAMEVLFDRHPEWTGRVTLLQVAVPSREGIDAFERLKDSLYVEVGRLNSRLGTPTWRPVVNLERALPLEDLVGLYLASDLCLVTPLRDGMNLVAKEYVLCRRNGAVVLSEFAGAATDLPGAVIVNPFSAESVAEGVHEALTLRPAERRRRFNSMRRASSEKDLQWWRREFMKQLEQG